MPITIGKYETIQLLGSGATAEVYQARDIMLDRQVALKLLKPALVADAAAFNRFSQEARSAARLFHPYLATVLDMGEAGGRYFIAMRYIPGQSLDHILHERGALAWEEILRLAQHVGGALDYAHGEGILHRDVKPSNIIRSTVGEYILTDFGLTRAMMTTGLTSHTGAVMGTPAYIAPEVWLGEAAMPATDQYALACVVYEALTGQVLFSGNTPPAIMTNHILKGPELLRQKESVISLEVQNVLARALNRNPGERFASIALFAQALQETGEPVIVRPAETILQAALSETIESLSEPLLPRQEEKPSDASLAQAPVETAPAMGFEEASLADGALSASMRDAPVQGVEVPKIEAEEITAAGLEKQYPGIDTKSTLPKVAIEAPAVETVMNGEKSVEAENQLKGYETTEPARHGIAAGKQAGRGTKIVQWLFALVVIGAFIGIASALLTGVFSPAEPQATVSIVLPTLAQLGAAQFEPTQTAAPTPTILAAPTGALPVFNGTIKIGLLAPLTGAVPTFGQSTVEGVELAVQEWNAKGGINGQKIELIVEDTQCEADPAVNAANKLIDQDGVKYLIGEVCSKASIPVSEIANAKGVIQITPTSTNEWVTVDSNGNTKDYIFRACFIDPFQGLVMAKFASGKGYKTAFVMYDQGNDYTVGLAESFEKAFTDLGGRVIGKETYASTDTNFSAILTKAKDSGAEILYLPDYYNIVNLVGAQAKQIGLQAVMMGGDGWDSSDLDVAAADGGFYSNHYDPGDTRPIVVDWVKRYGQAYQNADGTPKVPDAQATLAYDAAQILFTSIQEAGYGADTARVAESMAAGTFEVVSGMVSFDEFHNPIKNAAIIGISNGEKIFFESVAP